MLRLMSMTTMVALFAMSLTATPVRADPPFGFKGVFESPLVDASGDTGINADCLDGNDDGECDDSEAKIGRDGSWKVEVLGVTEESAFDICLDQNGGDETLATGVLSDDEGELVADTSDGVAVSQGVHEAPVIAVRETDGGCGGAVVVETGLAVD